MAGENWKTRKLARSCKTDKRIYRLQAVFCPIIGQKPILFKPGSVGGPIAAPRIIASSTTRIDRGEVAPSEQKQPRREAAPAADPIAHRAGIGLQHSVGR